MPTRFFKMLIKKRDQRKRLVFTCFFVLSVSFPVNVQGFSQPDRKNADPQQDS